MFTTASDIAAEMQALRQEAEKLDLPELYDSHFLVPRILAAIEELAKVVDRLDSPLLRNALKSENDRLGGE